MNTSPKVKPEATKKVILGNKIPENRANKCTWKDSLVQKKKMKNKKKTHPAKASINQPIVFIPTCCLKVSSENKQWIVKKKRKPLLA